MQTNAFPTSPSDQFCVEQVGYDPTPSDFQSDAMTTSATTPLVYFRENDGIRTHDQRSHNPLLYQLSYNLHNLWGERDLDPQSQMRKDLQSLRLPVTGYLPSICLDDTTRTYARHYSMLRFPKPARFTNSSTSRLYFSKLINELKNKKSFVITEEALYKLYYIVTLITFLKIYFITIPISKRHAIKWTSAKG